MRMQNNLRPGTATLIKRSQIFSSKSLRKAKCLNMKSQVTKFYCMKTISELIRQKEKSSTSIHKTLQNCGSQFSRTQTNNYRWSQSRIYVSQKRIMDKRDSFNTISNTYYQKFRQNLIQRNPNLKAKVRYSLLVENKDKNKICQFISENMTASAFGSTSQTSKEDFLPYNYQNQHLNRKLFQKQSLKQKQQITIQQSLDKDKKKRKQGFCHKNNYSPYLNQKNKSLNLLRSCKQNVFYHTKKNIQNPGKKLKSNIQLKRTFKKNVISSILYKDKQRQAFTDKTLPCTQINFAQEKKPFQVFIIDEWKDPEQLSLSRLMA